MINLKWGSQIHAHKFGVTVANPGNSSDITQNSSGAALLAGGKFSRSFRASRALKCDTATDLKLKKTNEPDKVRLENLLMMKNFVPVALD